MDEGTSALSSRMFDVFPKAADAGRWFYWLERKYLAEKKLWELFCAGFETDKMGRLYLEFRDCLIRGESPKPSA